MSKYRIRPVSFVGHFEAPDHYVVEVAQEHKTFGFWPTYKWFAVKICTTHAEAVRFLKGKIEGGAS